jgi:hypothetical protein
LMKLRLETADISTLHQAGQRATTRAAIVALYRSDKAARPSPARHA